MGVILYNKGYEMIEPLYSAAVDTSFDTRFEFNIFHEEQKEVGICISISHK